MAVYLTPTELLTYYDVRRVKEMASDTGVPVADLETSASLLAAIRSASAELDSALQVGKRYQRQVVEDLINESRGSGDERVLTRAAIVQEIVAHLTFGRLMSRRGFAADKMKQLAPMVEQAQERIRQLSSGLAVLDLDANIDAGVPKVVGIGSRNPSLSQTIRMFGMGNRSDLINGLGYGASLYGGY